MRSTRRGSVLVLGTLLGLLEACPAEDPTIGDAAVDTRPPTRDTPAADMPQVDSRPPPVDTGVPTDTGVPVGDTAATPDVVTMPDVPRCGAGVDSDGDGLNDDVECMLGTDPTRRDSDGDGAADGAEVRYPRVCVAMAGGRQRRPPPACRMDSDCMAGERCAGLDPSRPDSDGDGVPDGAEDTNLDGMIDRSRGETDPRLTDTDGDGMDDSRGSLEICRPSGLATVTQLGLPMAQVQVGHDPRWGAARRAAGTVMRSVVVLEDPAASVAGAVFNLRAMGVDLRAEAARVEGQVVAGLGAGVAPVLVGRAFTTHEMFNAVASLFRVARPAATTATALRDGLVMPLSGVAAPAGGRPVGASMEFLVDVTTTLRTSGLAAGTLDVVVTIAPRAEYENNALATSIRAIDLVNTTGLAPIDRGLGAACQVFRAERPPVVDFLWTVDTSGSMNDDQERLGRTASRFFARLNAAGVDFRVGVVNAGSGTLNIDSPGFRWISGTDPTGARTLCETVTVGTCPGSPTDRVAPYPFSGGSE
ncbi:MAG: hypothetical protein HY909_04050, partial [Deltaproteobacteria bacterium]|nr:hypothetical protein [Deltaproteobacteria bacterium]